MGIGPLIAWRRASLRSLQELHLARDGRARRRRHPARARCRLLAGRSHRVHLCGLRARLDRLRVRAGDTGAAGAQRRFLAVRVQRPGRSQPPALRRVRRARVDRAPGDRRRGVERVRHRPPAEAEPWADDGRRRLPAHLSRSEVRQGRTPRSFARISTSSGTGSHSGRSRPARTTTARRTRSRTRSASVATS